MNTDDPAAPMDDPSGPDDNLPSAPAPKPRLMHADRDRAVAVPINIDALIGPEHTARVVWAFVEQLDLAPLRATVRSVEGRPGRPAILVALWLYATIDGVGSARQLERLCQSDAVYLRFLSYVGRREARGDAVAPRVIPPVTAVAIAMRLCVWTTSPRPAGSSRR